MKEYKRLTERKKHGIAVLDTGERFVLSCGGYATTKALNRLAELEDKIENGTLIELPCNIGDKIWYITMRWCDGKFVGEIYDANVSGFYVSDGLIQIEDDVIYDYHNYGEEVFLTKAEAEAKLKELQNERNSD